jgi:hypothetical protein
MGVRLLCSEFEALNWMTTGYFKSHDKGRIYSRIMATVVGKMVTHIDVCDGFYPTVGYYWMVLGGFLATKNGGKTKKHLASVQGLRELFLFASLMIHESLGPRIST